MHRFRRLSRGLLAYYRLTVCSSGCWPDRPPHNCRTCDEKRERRVGLH